MHTRLGHILSADNGSYHRTKLWRHRWEATLTPLPSSGLLAGGAVASAILTEAWGGTFPINDLDVFDVVWEEETPSRTPYRVTEMALVAAGWGWRIFIAP